MPNAKIDANEKNTWTAYNETTGLIEDVVVDPVTGALLVFGVTFDGNTPTALNRSLIDANDIPTETGYNETSGLIEALRCGSGGELLIISV